MDTTPLILHALYLRTLAARALMTAAEFTAPGGTISGVNRLAKDDREIGRALAIGVDEFAAGATVVVMARKVRTALGGQRPVEDELDLAEAVGATPDGGA